MIDDTKTDDTKTDNTKTDNTKLNRRDLLKTTGAHAGRELAFDRFRGGIP